MDNRKPKNASELARLLKVTRQVVSAHRRKPNAPAIADVKAWRIFLAEVSRNGAITPETAENIGQQNLRIKRALAEKVERENKVRNGEVIEFAEVRRHALDINSFFFGELDRLRQTLPALLKGRPELEIFTTLESEIGKIKLGLKTRLERMVA